jgi:hypothetical protein
MPDPADSSRLLWISLAALSSISGSSPNAASASCFFFFFMPLLLLD